MQRFANAILGDAEFRGRTNRVFGKPCFCPLPKRGHFDENGGNDEFAFYPPKTRVWLLGPPKTTKMAGVTQEKAPRGPNDQKKIDPDRKF